jgi:oligoribonuclease
VEAESIRLRQAARLSSSAEATRRKKANMFQKTPVDGKIIWVDCEMSGLNPVKDKILEIGMVITDENLNVIAEHDSVVFHVEEPVLEGMDAWCQKHHGESGLIESCRKSTVTFEAADEALLKFVQEHTTPRECPMAGNSIGQDAGFIRVHLPKLYSHFHYRVIDVSSLKELVRRWDPKAYAGAPKKKFSHRVLDDIKDSIEELRYYRSAVFRLPEESAESVEQAKE